MKNNPLNLEHIKHLDTLLEQHGGQGGTHLQAIYETGFLSDIFRAHSEGKLTAVNRRRLQKIFEENNQEGTGQTQPPQIILLTPLRDGFPLRATPAKAMSTLFLDGNGVRYYHRDKCLDDRFIPTCGEGKEGTFRIVALPKIMKPKEMAQLATGNIADSIGDLSRAIVAEELDITPVQFEEQIIATEKGEDVLRKGGWVNLAFSKTGKVLEDAKGKYDEIVVLCASYYKDRWGSFAFSLDDWSEWIADNRLLLRNKS